MSQVSFKQVEEFPVTRLDLRDALRSDAKSRHGPPHMALGSFKARLTNIGRGARNQSRGEVVAEEGAVCGVEIPAVVHRRAQQSLTAEQFEDVPNQALAWCVDPSRPAGRGMGLEPLDDVGSVLKQLTIGQLHDRYDRASQTRDNHLDEARLSEGPRLESNSLLEKIGPYLGGIERAWGPIELQLFWRPAKPQWERLFNVSRHALEFFARLSPNVQLAGKTSDPVMLDGGHLGRRRHPSESLE